MKGLLILTVAATAAQMTFAQMQIQQWETSVGGNGHFYAVVPLSPSAPDWISAQNRALSMNGYLATVSSADENLFIASLCSNPVYWRDVGDAQRFGPWLGGIQIGGPEPAGGWQWVTNEPWGYTNWAAGEPNNINGNEDRVALYSTNGSPGSRWNDFHWTGRGYNETALVGAFVAEFNCMYILAQPVGTYTCTGVPAAFEVVAGGGDLSCAWQLEYTPNNWQTLGRDPLPLLCGGSVRAEPPNQFLTTIRIDGCAGRFRVRALLSNACGSVTSAAATLTVVRWADLNCDCVINNFDIDPFAMALTDPAAYSAAFPMCDATRADVNRDGAVNNSDVDPFVRCLIAGLCN